MTSNPLKLALGVEPHTTSITLSSSTTGTHILYCQFSNAAPIY